MILTIIARFTGFLREIVLSYYYGASIVSDAFLISLTIPGVVFSFIISGVTTGYIPMYNKILEEKGEIQTKKFTNNLINFMLVLCTIIIILVLLFTEPLIKVFAKGFTGDVLSLTILYTRILVLGIYFTGIVTIFTSILQIKNSFIASQLISLPSNLIWIIAIYLGKKYNNIFLPCGGVLAVIIQMFFLLPHVKKNGFKYLTPKIDFKDKYLKELIYLSLPIIIGVSVNQINTLVDKNIASTFGVGGITSLNYANILNVFITGLFVGSIVTVFYPKISKMVVKNDNIGIKNNLKEAIVIVNILIIPITVGSMIFSKEIIGILFGRGAFNLNALKMTEEALWYYSIGMIGVSLRQLLSGVFYAYQDNKTPMINAAIGMILNICLNIILSKYMGLKGLAFATSISAIVTALMMAITLRKKIGPYQIKDIIKVTLKILGASIMMGIISKLSFIIIKNRFNENLSLILSVLIGIFSYVIIILFLKIKDIDILVDLIREKIKISNKSIK